MSEHEPPPAPEMPLRRTLIRNIQDNEQLLWLDGPLVLPIGTVIQLGRPNRDATVAGVELLAGPDYAYVVLDVEVVSTEP